MLNFDEGPIPQRLRETGYGSVCADYRGYKNTVPFHTQHLTLPLLLTILIQFIYILVWASLEEALSD